jgi:hypothetical protein
MVAISFQEIREVAILRYNYNVRFWGGIEDLAIVSIPATYVPDRNCIELEFPRGPAANEGEGRRPTRFSSPRDRMTEALARVAQAGRDIFTCEIAEFSQNLSR